MSSSGFLLCDERQICFKVTLIKKSTKLKRRQRSILLKVLAELRGWKNNESRFLGQRFILLLELDLG